MVVIQDRSWLRLSAIIGVCGTNFCAFEADKRIATNTSDGFVAVNDTATKIFKLNDRALFGATGLFNLDEKITSAVDSIPNIANASLEEVVEAVNKYLEDKKFILPPTRNYLVGGKNQDGIFCIYEIRLNNLAYTVEKTIRKPYPPSSNFAISCALPPKAVPHQERLVKMVESNILSSSSVDELLSKNARVIGEISKIDDTVGGNIDALIVT